MGLEETMETVVRYAAGIPAFILGSYVVAGALAYTIGGIKCGFDYYFRNPDNLNYNEIWELDMQKETFTHKPE